MASSSVTPRPQKSRFDAIGWLFGNPLETFDDLLPIGAPISTDKSICPTKQNVIQHWIFCFDKNRTSYKSPDKNTIIGEVTDNLMFFWTNKTSVELR